MRSGGRAVAVCRAHVAFGAVWPPLCGGGRGPGRGQHLLLRETVASALEGGALVAV